MIQNTSKEVIKIVYKNFVKKNGRMLKVHGKMKSVKKIQNAM